MAPLKVKFLVIKDAQGKPLVALSWQDYLTMAEWMGDLKEYIEGTEALLCYYRKELEELVCQKKQI